MSLGLLEAGKLTNFQSSVSKSNEKPIQNVKQLPDDLEKIVGKTYLKAIDLISKIQTFFLVIFSKKIGSWKSFKSDFNKRSYEVSTERKMKLYQKYKRSCLDSDIIVRIGYKTENESTASSLKESNKNLEEYKESKIKVTQTEKQKLKQFLESISAKEIKDDHLLVDLNMLLSRKDIPKDIKDLIDSKLDQLPEYQVLKKNLELKKQQDFLRLQRNNNLKKAILVSLVFATLAIVGFSFYQYMKVPIIEPTLVPKVVEPTLVSKTLNLTQKPVTSWFNFEILGRTSNIGIRDMFLDMGSFFIKRPYEVAKNSKFLIWP